MGGEAVTVTYFRAGGIDNQRAATAGGKPPTPVSNAVMVTGLGDSEPVVVLRGRDAYAHEALARYADSVAGIALPGDLQALRDVLDEFDRYQRSHADLLAIHVPGEVR